MVSTLTPSAVDTAKSSDRPRRRRSNPYPLWFFAIPAVLFLVLFAIPTFASFYFSLTRWTIFDSKFIGFDNYVTFFSEPALVSGLTHTLIYDQCMKGQGYPVALSRAHEQAIVRAADRRAFLGIVEQCSEGFAHRFELKLVMSLNLHPQLPRENALQSGPHCSSP